MANELVDQYTLMLIKQYWEKPRARAEIELLMSGWQRIADFYKSFLREFDLDTARGWQLDVIGKIIGLPRVAPDVIVIERFGFMGNPNARGFADRFGINRPSAPFSDRFATDFSPLLMDDSLYRRMLRAKAVKNSCSAVLVSDDRPSLQDVIIIAFNYGAYLTDNHDMTMTLLVADFVEDQTLKLVQKLDLIPMPMGVSYNVVRL